MSRWAPEEDCGAASWCLPLFAVVPAALGHYTGVRKGVHQAGQNLLFAFMWVYPA